MKNTKVKDINSTIFYQLSAPCFYPHMWMNSASSQRTVVLRAIALQLAHFHDKAIVKIKHTRSFSLTNYTLELFPDDVTAQNNVTVSAEVKSLLQDVSDNEIRDFLKETGSLDQATDDDIILN